MISWLFLVCFVVSANAVTITQPRIDVKHVATAVRRREKAIVIGEAQRHHDAARPSQSSAIEASTGFTEWCHRWSSTDGTHPALRSGYAGSSGLLTMHDYASACRHQSRLL